VSRQDDVESVPHLDERNLMNQVEQDVMKKIMTYTIALRQWQTENSVEPESGDPLLA